MKLLHHADYMIVILEKMNDVEEVLEDVNNICKTFDITPQNRKTIYKSVARSSGTLVSRWLSKITITKKMNLFTIIASRYLCPEY